MKLRLGLVCTIGALAVVAAGALILPRGYLVNDDEAITDFVRGGDLAPFILPALSQLLSELYRVAPGVPWYGLWQYAVDVGALGLGTAVLLEVVPSRRLAVALATPTVIAVASLAWQPTFTTGATLACGVALIAFAAEALRGPMRGERALFAGLVLASGIATRPYGLLAAIAVTLPLLALTSWRLLRTRTLVPRRSMAAFLAPAVIAIVLGPFMPQARDPVAQQWSEWNAERGAVQGMASYAHVSPHIRQKAGWDVEHLVRFRRFLALDESWYTSDRLQALLATGGRSPRVTLRWIGDSLRDAETNALDGTPLLGLVFVASLTLAGLGLARPHVAAFALAEVAALAAISIWLERSMRFPTRVALPMAVLGAIAAIATIGQGMIMPALPTSLRARWPIATIGGVILLLLFVVEVRRLAQLDPAEPAQACRDFQARVGARDPALVVMVTQPLCADDPLQVETRPYPTAMLGWTTFSPPWYRALARIGVSRGADLVAALAVHEDAYVMVARMRLPETLAAFRQDVADLVFDIVDQTGDTPSDLVLARARHGP